MLTAKRLKQYERLISRVRRDPRLFDDDAKADQIGRVIDKAKARCADNWHNRHQRHIEAQLNRLGY